MEEIIEEEQNAVFQLGITIVAIKMLYGGNQTPKTRCKIRFLYNKYIGIARKLSIQLQDPPPEETITDAEMETLITEQINQIDDCLARRGNMYITLYNACCQLSYLMACLTFKCKDNPEERIQVNESIRTCAKKLESCAAELDIDLSEELEKATNIKQMKEITEIERQMKEKFYRRKRCQNKLSEIDQTQIITDKDWTVSLVRLPDSSCSEHAFLVVEGKSGYKSMIWFIDFVARNPSDLYRPRMRDGKVRVDFHESNKVNGSSSKLLFQGHRMMMKIQKGDRLLLST